MIDLEKLGAFYLGREYDIGAQRLLDAPVMYDARDLTTHAVCVGMTGSGKTGLCISLLEEAALDSVPAIIVDPKGDMTNLLLTFPELRPADFGPWVNLDDARRKGVSVDEYAQSTAASWRSGLAQWGQAPERIRRAEHEVLRSPRNARIVASEGEALRRAGGQRIPQVHRLEHQVVPERQEPQSPVAVNFTLADLDKPAAVGQGLKSLGQRLAGQPRAPQQPVQRSAGHQRKIAQLLQGRLVIGASRRLRSSVHHPGPHAPVVSAR